MAMIHRDEDWYEDYEPSTWKKILFFAAAATVTGAVVTLALWLVGAWSFS